MCFCKIEQVPVTFRPLLVFIVDCVLKIATVTSPFTDLHVCRLHVCRVSPLQPIVLIVFAQLIWFCYSPTRAVVAFSSVGGWALTIYCNYCCRMVTNGLLIHTFARFTLVK